jgi:hypothetical protein
MIIEPSLGELILLAQKVTMIGMVGAWVPGRPDCRPPNLVCHWRGEKRRMRERRIPMSCSANLVGSVNENAHTALGAHFYGEV